MAAIEIRRRQTGTHPVKKYRYSFRPGEFEQCFAQVLAVVDGYKDAIAISANGTAVFTKAEFDDWVADIRKAL